MLVRQRAPEDWPDSAANSETRLVFRDLTNHLPGRKTPGRARAWPGDFDCRELLLFLGRVEILARVVLELPLHAFERVLGRRREVAVAGHDAHRDARLHVVGLAGLHLEIQHVL